MEPLTVVSVALGDRRVRLGLAADRFATRWPEHDEEHPPGRRVDWRTGLVGGHLGASPSGCCRSASPATRSRSRSSAPGSSRSSSGSRRDLDQRLLPDVLTLPVIPVALVYALSGQNPFVGGSIVLAVIAAIVVPLLLYLPSIPFGAGAFGMGDVKLLAGVGPADRRQPPGRLGRVRAGALGRRAGRPARDQADRAQDVRPVRAVLHHRRALGGPVPALSASPRRSARVRRSGVPRSAGPSSPSDSCGPAARLGEVSSPDSRCRPVDVPDLDGDEPAGVTVRRRPCGETRENDPRSHLAR